MNFDFDKEQIKTARGLNVTVSSSDLAKLENTTPQTIAQVLNIIDLSYYLPSCFMFLSFCILLFVPFKLYLWSYILYLLAIFCVSRVFSYICFIYKFVIINKIISLFIFLHAFLLTEIIIAVTSYFILHNWVYAIVFYTIEFLLMLRDLFSHTIDKLARKIIHYYFV